MSENPEIKPQDQPDADEAQPQPGTNQEDHVQVTQGILEEVLTMLGEAWAENERLRAELAVLQKTDIGHPNAAGAGQTASDKPVRSGILIVDDSKVLQMRLRSMIENLGYEVAGVAENGREGLKLALKLHPRLIILDYMMPEMNGVECLRSIRHVDGDVHVIICAADITSQMSRQFIQAGVTAMLTKPINPDRLVEAVHKCMG